MELAFEKDDLLSALQVLQGVASGQTTLPILSNVLIQAADGTIECAATDLEVGIKIKVEGIIQEEGAITVSAKKLTDVVKALPQDHTIHLTTTANDRIEITCANGVYKIIGLSDDEFPQLPAVEGESLTIEGEVLREMLDKTEFAAATEDVRYFLNGLYFHFLPDRLEVVATDMRWLAVARAEPIAAAETLKGFIVPLKAVKAIARTFSDSDSVEVSVLENQILFADATATLTTRLVEGDYPPYQKIIPDSMEGQAVVDRTEMLQATRRVALLSNPKNYAIALEIDTERVQISAKTPELGEAEEPVDVETGTGSTRIGIDARLLVGTLEHLQSRSIAITFRTEVEPVVFRPHDPNDETVAESHICLVMPMRLDS